MSKIERLITGCTRCDSMSCYSNSCPPSGKTDARIMFIGFNPLRNEVFAKEPFASDENRSVLGSILKSAGLKWSDIYMTYAVKGYKEESKPAKVEIENCRAAFLFKEIVAAKPQKIVVFGKDALCALLSRPQFSEVVNRVYAGPNFHIFVAYSPSYFERIGYNTTQYQAFCRELLYFLKDYKPKVKPLQSEDDLQCSYTIEDLRKASENTDLDNFEYLEYKSGKQALQLFTDMVHEHASGSTLLAFDIEADRLKLDLCKPSDTLLSVAIADEKQALSVAMVDLSRFEQDKLTLAIVDMFHTQPVVGHHLKFDIKLFVRRLMQLSSHRFNSIRLYDSMIACYLHTELEHSYGLKDILARKYALPDYSTDVPYDNLREMPVPSLRRYNARDAFWTRRLFVDTWKLLTKKQQLLCKTLLSDMILSVAFMEVCGLPYNPIVTRNLRKFLEKQIKLFGSEFTDLCDGEAPNTRSNKQLTEFIINQGWSVDGLETTAKGELGRDVDNLSKLIAANPKRKDVKEFVSIMLQSNKFKHMLSKVDGKNAYDQFVLDDKRVHTSWNMIYVATGRLSTSDPNVLNVDREDRLPKVMQQAEYKCLQPRNQFRTTKGKSMVAADLAQAELRVLTCYSHDKAFTEAFTSGKDPHAMTASDMFGESVEHIKTDESIAYMRQVAKCFHPDTEVLTRGGWKRIVDLGMGEEVIQATPLDGGFVTLDWCVPIEVFTMRHSSKQLVHLKNEGIDLRVTPDHRMLAFGRTGKMSVVTPYEMNDVGYWANAGGFCKDTSLGYIMPLLLKLAVVTQADGSINKYGGIRFGFTRQRKIKRIRKMLSAFPADMWCESVVGKEYRVTTFYIRPRLAQHILNLLEGKQFPWWWLELPYQLRRLVIRESRYWDSCSRANWRMFRYSSTKKQNIDVLQALCALTGCKTRAIRKDDGVYDLSIKDHGSTRGGNLSTVTSKYTGKVACLSVPSTFVLVRDGGIPVICGQSINFGKAYGQTEYGLFYTMRKSFMEQGLKFKLTLAQCEQFQDQWNETHYGAYKWIEQTKEFAQLNGYTETLFGRRRHFNMRNISDGQFAAMQREAVNHPIQGTSAEFTYVCMNRILKAARKIPGFLLVKNEYDAVYSEVDDQYIDELVDIYKECMPINVGDFDGFVTVPFGFDIKVGRSLSTMHQVYPAKD